MFGVKPQIQTTNGANGASAASKAPVILPFLKDNPTADEPTELSTWQQIAVKSGAAMTTPKTTDNAIKLNPTVLALLISLFGVLAILVPVFIQFGRLSEKIELNEKKMERVESELQTEKSERIRLDGKVSYMLGAADTHGKNENENEKKEKK